MNEVWVLLWTNTVNGISAVVKVFAVEPDEEQVFGAAAPFGEDWIKTDVMLWRTSGSRMLLMRCDVEM